MAEYSKNIIVSVVGPTASGKTGAGIEICRHFDGEVISFDSMQIYKGMDIATAKPTKDEMQGIPHHLMSFFSEDEAFSVSLFSDMAFEKTAEILKKGKLPVAVGGTGLYFDSFYNFPNYSFGEFDKEKRGELQKRAEKEGTEALYAELLEKDREAALRIHPNDDKRIIRALEVLSSGGGTIEDENARHKAEIFNSLRFINIMLDVRNRDFLYDRINRRVDRMLDDGLIEEAKAFYTMHLSDTCVQAIGYKELLPYILGEADLETCVEKLKQATRNYAKRQLSWFHRYKDFKVFYIDGYPSAEELYKDITDYVGGEINAQI